MKEGLSALANNTRPTTSKKGGRIKLIFGGRQSKKRQQSQNL